MWRRCTLALWLLTVLGYTVVPPAYGQEDSLQIEQSESVAFGDSITFTITVRSPTRITSAELIFQALDRTPLVANVPMTPGPSLSLTYRVEVSDADIPPFARLTYQWQLHDEAGGQINSEVRAFRYEDNRVPWEWQASSIGNIIVHTNGQDPVLAQAALDIALEAQGRINQTLQAPPQAETHIYIYPELSHLVSALRVHDRSVQDWVAAYSIPDQSVILIAATSGPEMLPSLQRDIPHELTHLLVYGAVGPQNIKQVPGWFNEGLALMSAYEPDPTLHSTLREATLEGVLLSMDTLCVPDFTDLPPRDAALAYAQSESLMRYISDRYGSSQVRAMMNAYASGASCSGGVHQALGIPLSSLESQWHNSLRGEVARSPESETSLTPWLIVWAASLILAALFIAPQPPRLSRADEQTPKTPFSDS